MRKEVKRLEDGRKRRKEGRKEEGRKAMKGGEGRVKEAQGVKEKVGREGRREGGREGETAFWGRQNH